MYMIEIRVFRKTQKDKLRKNPYNLLVTQTFLRKICENVFKQNKGG
jgi:hypothetical protein